MPCVVVPADGIYSERANSLRQCSGKLHTSLYKMLEILSLSAYQISTKVTIMIDNDNESEMFFCFSFFFFFFLFFYFFPFLVHQWALFFTPHTHN